MRVLSLRRPIVMASRRFLGGAGPRSPAMPLAVVASLLAVGAAPLPVPASAQTVGPGNVGPQTVGPAAETLTVVGNTTITATGSQVDGLNASGSGIGILDTTGGPISVTVTGNLADALYAEGGGTITSLGPGVLSLSTSGLAANAVEANEGGAIALQNVNIVHSGIGGAGVTTVGTGLLTINGGSITTSGFGAAGSVGGGTINLTNVAISTSGEEGFGAVTLTGATNLSNVSIATTGIGAHGIVVTFDGTITGGGVTVETTGAGASALSFDPLGFGGINTASLTDSSLASANAPAITVLGGSNTLTLAGSSVTSPVQWLDVSGGSAVDITASSSVLTGAASTEAGSSSDVTLQDGTLWTMTGSSTLTSLVNGATIAFAPPVADPTQLASYKTLTVARYAGNGGTLGLNTFLGGDSSPSDRLVIDGGMATGSTLLNISNTLGLGDQTTGSGILVIDAVNGGTTAAGAFALAGPVIAGPYEYTLFKGNGDPNDWYLRSTLNCSLPGAPADLCPPAPCPSPPPAPEPSPAPPQAPHFRQEVALYSAVPGLSLIYGRALIDSLSASGPRPQPTGRRRSSPPRPSATAAPALRRAPHRTSMPAPSTVPGAA